MNMIKKSKSVFAFTLAEVLITLGVIGVVAAITMPTLIQNYQKSKTANQLKTVYSIMNQAVKMSEIDNGLITEWTFPENNAESIKAFLNKYIAPYLKYTKMESNETGQVYLYLSDGIIVQFHSPSVNQIHSNVFFNGNINKSIAGKNRFLFLLSYPNNDDANCIHKRSIYGCKYSGYMPYSYVGISVDNSKPIRDFIKDGSGSYGCNENAKATCGALIMHDGWQIKEDYPW